MLAARLAAAQEEPDTVEEPAPPGPAGGLAIHGFVSQGAFATTANNYIGHSRRGSLEMMEAGVNASAEVADRLRVGLQLFGHDFGSLGDYSVTVDWAYLDYRWRDWLGLRAGRIKMPFGLHNEFSDVDSARLPILLPQSIYPVENRDFLLAHTGFALYGSAPAGGAGSLDYQLLGGTIFLDPGRSLMVGEIDTKYVVGGQVFWRPPVDGLRVGGSLLRGAIEINALLDQRTIDQLIAAGQVPADFDGQVELRIDPFTLWVASAEYTTERWSASAEYSRWLIDTQSNLPAVAPAGESESERFYAMGSYRLHDQVEAGLYYSVYFVDAGDRDGSGPQFAGAPHRAYQKDLAATVRYDVNEQWLWKIEAHYLDGTAALSAADNNPDPDEHWGLALIKTTVTF